MVRRVAPDGTITTIAGAPDQVGIVLGPAPGLAAPLGMALAGDSLVTVDGGAVLLLRHGAIDPADR
jgi:hypothetical protein